MNNRRIAIFGTGQTGRQALAILEDLGSDDEVVGFFDDDEGKIGSEFEHRPVLGDRSAVAQVADQVVVAIGQLSARAEVTGWFEAEGVPLASAIHPSVDVPRRSTIGDGTIICAGTVLSTNPEIGSSVFIGPSVTISHDTFIGNNCLLSVGSTVGARVDAEDRVFVGAAASVMPTGWGTQARLRLGAGSTVGVGSVVIRDVPAGRTVVGVPARVLEKK